MCVWAWEREGECVCTTGVCVCTTRMRMCLRERDSGSELSYSARTQTLDNSWPILTQSTHKGVNYRLKDVTQAQQQSPESPTVTLTWHEHKYKVHKLHQRYILCFLLFLHNVLSDLHKTDILLTLVTVQICIQIYILCRFCRNRSSWPGRASLDQALQGENLE